MSRNSESLVVHWEISAVFGTMISVGSCSCEMAKAPITVFPNPVGAENSAVVLEQLAGSMLLLGTKYAFELGRNVFARVPLVVIGVVGIGLVEQLKQALLAPSWKSNVPLAGFAEEDHAMLSVDRLVHGLGAIELGVGECGKSLYGIGGLGVKG